MKIFKYKLDVTQVQKVEIHKNFIPLCVQIQHGVPCLWAQVDDTAEKVEYPIFIVGTGYEIPEPIGETPALQYLGTVQMTGGAHVWHYYLGNV